MTLRTFIGLALPFILANIFLYYICQVTKPKPIIVYGVHLISGLIFGYLFYKFSAEQPDGLGLYITLLGGWLNIQVVFALRKFYFRKDK